MYVGNGEVGFSSISSKAHLLRVTLAVTKYIHIFLLSVSIVS